MLRERNNCVELDAQMNLTLSDTATNVLCCTICLPLCGGMQYGIVVMGVIDAFVYAHNHHRRNIENPGNFGDCMRGRIRFMTAITPASAHAYQLICLTRHVPLVPSQKFRLPAAKARYPHLPNIRSTTREKGNDFQVWAIYAD